MPYRAETRDGRIRPPPRTGRGISPCMRSSSNHDTQAQVAGPITLSCAKAERFHQILKRHLARQPKPVTVARLQAQLDRVGTCFNTASTRSGPRWAIGRRTPADAFAARTKATPKTRRSPPRATIEFVSTASTRSAPVTLRYRSKLFPHRNRPGLRREQGTFSSSTTSTSGSSPRTGKYSASRPLTRQGPTSPVDEPRTLMRPRIVRVVPRHDNFGRLLFEPALHRRRRPVTLRSRHPSYGVAMGHVLTT